MDTIEIKLPASGKTAVIRNYTTRADDEAAEELLYKGVNATSGKDGERTEFPLANVMLSQDVYVKRLVVSLEGSTEFDLGQLRTEDYKAIEAAVEKVTSKYSPKAKAA